MPGVPKKCTGVAGRAEFEINVAGGNPVILDVGLAAARGDGLDVFSDPCCIETLYA
jgi:hypothetical protein